MQISISNSIRGFLYGGGVTPPSGTLLLDAYPGAAAAYSLRKLSSTYAGSSIRVRRSSDNTETDIGFVSNVLDTATLLTFCGIGNGFVTTWYDQSGSGYNTTQITALNQPQIVDLGSLYLINTKPCIWFNAVGTGKILQNTLINIAQPNTVTTVTRPTAYMAGSNLFDGLTARQAIFANPSNALSFFAGTAQASSITLGTVTPILINTIFNGASTVLYKNNVLLLSANGGANGLNGLTIGGYPTGGSYWQGYIPEFIIWNSNQSTNNTPINTNINSYYNIY